MSPPSQRLLRIVPLRATRMIGAKLLSSER